MRYLDTVCQEKEAVGHNTTVAGRIADYFETT